MEATRSPLFPDASLALSPARDENPEEQVFLPNLPDAPQASSSSVQVFIVPAEKHLFLQGFKPAEFENRPPSLLRGCLVLRILKPAKVKSLSLHFKGIQRTEWPEGIPPKRTNYAEVNDLINHTWPFYHADTHTPTFGADFVRPLPANTHKASDDITHFSLSDPHTGGTDSFLSPVDTAKGFAASLINRATSPRGTSPSPAPGITPVSSMQDLTTMRSAGSATDSPIANGPPKPGYFTPGDYIYNFEHPLPASSPETVDTNFGRVFYNLEANVIRMGAFKTNLTARLPVSVVRIPSDSSVEENEPIFIERDWEDQLRYEILVGSKAVVLDTYVPISFKFIPLYGKVALHRIRVSITENCNYYCHNKTVHRAEPTRKFLLLEHKAKPNKSLLSKQGCLTDDGPDVGTEEDEVLPRELEFQMFVPSTINKKYNFAMHPDTSFENIQCDHWIKISLRISRKDPSNPEKRKHFEISIDSPIHLCSPLAAHCNTLLPAYNRTERLEPLPQYAPSSPPMSPEVTVVDQSQGVGHSIFSALSGYGNSQSSPASSEGSSRLISQARSATPLSFRHLSNSDEPIEKDHRIHLEANLYSPSEANVLESLGSPQAQPFSRPQSPAHSPAPFRPDAQRRPTVNPPSFEAINHDFDETLPPAYERDDPATSPVRNEGTSAVNADKRKRSSGAKETIPAIELSRPSTDASVNPSGIKNQLSKQFEPVPRTSTGETNNSATTLTENNKESTSMQRDPSDLRVSESSSIPRPKSPRIPESENDMDLSDVRQATSGPASPAIGPLVSRESSVASAVDDDLPLEQTLPLLTLNEGYTDDNLSNFSLDQGRRPSAFVNTSMTDLMDNNMFVGRSGIESHIFRNPRLKKHYQGEEEEEEPPSSHHDKDRQKSFGVIPNSDIPQSSTAERSSTASSTQSEWISEVTDSSGNKAHEGFRVNGLPKDVKELVK
ncbi:hypothetical protein FT663_04766 [Candidozyma haemuli var. vulneris]|nr:hypothetical protein FT663_04766 [[Candida] haemuloni var. vulneris]KAF3987847.1 hypothetical protein FT662_03738 [[Candida] haemuloni var. vulneris]